MDVDQLLECTFQICDVCRELEKLEEDVQAVQETLRKLSQKRTALNNSRNALHDRLSTNLPVKLICQIFIFVNQAHNHSSNNPPSAFQKVSFCAPVILSSVSRRWREITLSLPELWTNVYINLWRKPDQVIEDWLNRSGSLPLHLTLYANFKNRRKPGKPLIQKSLESVCNILRSHSARWQYLDVGFAAENTLYNLFNDLQVTPESDSFHLQLGEYNDKQTIILDTPLQPGRLHSAVRSISKVLPCEWNNLTCLELSRYEISEVLDIIEAAPRLKRCVSREMRSSAFKRTTPVEPKLLEDLELSFNCAGTSSTKFFRKIILQSPSLRHLTFDSNYNQELRYLMNFLVRSKISPPSLHTFTLEYHASSLPEHDHSGVLALEGITHLSIDIWPRSRILKSLMLRMSNLSVFPHLQDLRFKLMGNHPNVFVEPEVDPALFDFLTEHPQTSLEPGSYAALSEFVAKHNSQLTLAKDCLEHGATGHGGAENSHPPPQINTPEMDLTNNGTPSYRPLRSISIRKSDNILYIAQIMTETGPFLRESWRVIL